MEVVTQAKTRWNTLVHRGVAFPPEYQPRGITVSIKGEKLALNADQEELVYAWAKKKDTHYVQDPVFQSNFISDLKPKLPEKFRKMDLKISDFDFSQANRLADEEKGMKEREKDVWEEMKMWNEKKDKLNSVLWSQFVHINMKTQKPESHSKELMDLFSTFENPLPVPVSFEERIEQLRRNPQPA